MGKAQVLDHRAYFAALPCLGILIGAKFVSRDAPATKMVLEITAFWGGGLIVSFALTSLSVGKTHI